MGGLRGFALRPAPRFFSKAVLAEFLRAQSKNPCFPSNPLEFLATSEVENRPLLRLKIFRFCNLTSWLQRLHGGEEVEKRPHAPLFVEEQHDAGNSRNGDEERHEVE